MTDSFFEGWSQQEIYNFQQTCLDGTRKVWAAYDRDMAWITEAIEHGLRKGDCWLPRKAREEIVHKVFNAYREQKNAEDRTV
jgi:hypothetical protein